MDTSAADGRDRASDVDPLRALILGLLDRVEHFAASVIDERGSRAPDAADDGRAADIGPAVRAAVDAFIVDLAEAVARVMRAIIAALQAISDALDDLAAGRGPRPRRGDRRSGSFQPIVVEVDVDDTPRDR